MSEGRVDSEDRREMGRKNERLIKRGDRVKQKYKEKGTKMFKERKEWRGERVVSLR